MTVNREPIVRRIWVFALLHVLATTVGEAQASSMVGMLSSYRPLEGQSQAFEQGYVRHLRWHLATGDSIPWYLWRVMRGDRTGALIGGAFVGAWPTLENRPRTSEDQADHRNNVDRYETEATYWSRHVERRPELGGTLPPLERHRLLSVYVIELRPDARAAFEETLARRPAGGSYGWFAVTHGGAEPSYLLMVPADSFRGLAARWEHFISPPGAPRAAATMLSSIAAVRHELWRFLPEMSTCRDAASKCLGLASGQASSGPS